MDTLNAYFDDLTFYKVSLKEDFTLYAAYVSSPFGDNRKQYILAFVPSHMAILDQSPLRDLHWRSLQTRVLSNGYKIPKQAWKVPRGLTSPMFTLVDRNNDRTKYTFEGDTSVEMILLHDVKKKSVYQFGNKINVIAALTSFRCVVNLVDAHARAPARVALPPSRQPIQALATRMPAPPPAYRPGESESIYGSAPLGYGGGTASASTGAGVCTTKYCMYNAAKEQDEDQDQLAEPFQPQNQNTGSYIRLPVSYEMPKAEPRERNHVQNQSFTVSDEYASEYPLGRRVSDEYQGPEVDDAFELL